MADFDEVRAQYRRALETYISGDPVPVMRLGASQLRDGESFSLECISAYATTDLAYEVNVERSRVKVGGADEVAQTALRTTTIFRREDDGWRIVHRHADPITSPRPVESIVES